MPKKEEREEEDADLYVRVRAQKFVSDIFYSLNEFEAFSEDEVVSTFVRLMLDQVSSLYAIAPST